MTDAEASKLVAILFATFPGAKIEPRKRPDGTPTPGGGTAGVYARFLRDLDYDLAVAAVAKVAATFKFSNLLPTVGEIRDAAVVLDQGNVEPGGQAFGLVLGLMRPTRARRGYHAAEPPSQAVVEREAGTLAWRALQAIGGWRALCQAEESDPAPRSQFVRAYDAMAANARRDAIANTLPVVAGYLAARAADRAELPAPSEPMDLVGNLAKALGGGGAP